MSSGTTAKKIFYRNGDRKEQSALRLHGNWQKPSITPRSYDA